MYVALLRGINVGGKNKLSMADLRSVFEHQGFLDVCTYIQSGNVVFTSKKRPSAETLQRAVAEGYGIESPVVLRTADELAESLRQNPFSEAESVAVHVGFLAESPDKATVAALDHSKFAPDRFALVGREVYLYLPNGMARAKLPGHLFRKLGVVWTVRNWNTVNKLVGLSSR